MIVYDPNTGKSKSVVNWKVIKIIWIIFIISLIIHLLIEN